MEDKKKRIKLSVWIMISWAVVIGLAASLLMVPGKGVVLLNEAYEITEFPSVIDNFVGIVPDNPFAALNEGNMLQIIFIAIVLGIGITIAGGAGDAITATIVLRKMSV